MTERMLRLAPIVASIAAGATLALLMPTYWMSLIVFVGTIVAVVYLSKRPPKDHDRRYGR